MKSITRKLSVFIPLMALLLPALAIADANDFGPVDMGSFYTSLPPLSPDAKLGDLLKVEKIPTSMAGVNAWKIAYVSSDLQGHKTRVTGVVAAPQDIRPQADRPIMAWAHGTTGTAQTCGPSQVLNPAQPLNQYFMPTGNSWTDFGLPAMDAFIKAGYVIVATDYQGLGGGGKHQYTVAASQAHDLIDSIRAVALLKETQAGSKAIIYGWSQGGGAVLAAAGQSDYLNTKGSAHDGMQIVGTVALAPYDVAVVIPPGQLSEAESIKYIQELSNSFGANVFNFTHFAQNVWGMTAAYPELKLEDVLTDEGAKVADEIFSRKCMHAASGTFNYNYGANYKTLMRKDIKNAAAWVEAEKKGSVLPVKPRAPVIIYFGDHDTTVPPVMGKLYFEQMCKLGANVTRVQLPGDQDHFTTPPTAEPYYVKWVADRFAGLPAQNGCAAIDNKKAAS